MFHPLAQKLTFISSDPGSENANNNKVSQYVAYLFGRLAKLDKHGYPENYFWLGMLRFLYCQSRRILSNPKYFFKFLSIIDNFGLNLKIINLVSVNLDDNVAPWSNPTVLNSQILIVVGFDHRVRILIVGVRQTLVWAYCTIGWWLKRVNSIKCYP